MYLVQTRWRKLVSIKSIKRRTTGKATERIWTVLYRAPPCWKLIYYYGFKRLEYQNITKTPGMKEAWLNLSRASEKARFVPLYKESSMENFISNRCFDEKSSLLQNCSKTIISIKSNGDGFYSPNKNTFIVLRLYEFNPWKHKVSF